LNELGYSEGQNLTIDLRRAEGDLARLPDLAAEIVSLGPDVIVAIATPAIVAARKATSSIPIVMNASGDPVVTGLIKSLAKPGGNITGLSSMNWDLTTKSVELLSKTVPRAKRIAVLMSAIYPTHISVAKDVHGAALGLGLTAVPVTADVPEELGSAFATIRREKCDAVIVLPAAQVLRSIVDLAASERIPAIYESSAYVRIGGLMSYGANIIEQFRTAAVYVDKIPRGANPADLPVAQPTNFELAVNLRTANRLGIEIPPTVLALADEVID
jgi:putative tryptophan/tyrosine transport system substrate-binding protein